jgi:TolA-binding protein
MGPVLIDKTHTCGIAAVFFSAAVWCAAADLPFFLQIDTTGMASLRDGRYRFALESLAIDTAPRDSALHLFKCGLANAGLNQYTEAIGALRGAADRNVALVPAAYENIGDLLFRMKQNENAVTAYRSALSSPITDDYKRILRDKIYSVLKTDTSLASQISWFDEMKEYADVAREDWLAELLDTLLVAQRWPTADSLLEAAMSDSTQQTCAVLAAFGRHPIPDSQLTTRRLFELSRATFGCGDYRQAQERLERALSRKNASVVLNEKDLWYYQAMLDYRLKNYSGAVNRFDRYEKKYGLTPEIVMTIARSFRNIDKPAKAALWYDRYISLYPRDPKTADILWLRARQDEEQDKLRDAARRYRRIADAYPRNDLADDALFRAGFCRYKQGQFDSAIIVFSDVSRRFTSSGMAIAASYWKGRSLLALKKKEEARRLLRDLSAQNPIDYYGWRAREQLYLLQDSASVFGVDSAYDPVRARLWLDSIAGTKSRALPTADSTTLSALSGLSLCGLADRADHLMDQLMQRNQKSLTLPYDCAMMYQLVNDPARAFRAGKRISWRVPAESRRAVPLALYEMLYPFPYQSQVLSGTASFGIDPYLVCAVMRQESAFDPAATSFAGARGLMQIMPSTGEEIAGGLGIPFAGDSLYAPAISIRFGAWYLKKLIDDFSGSEMSAVAAYNGGPQNVKRWRAKYNHDPDDQFVENVGFNETREYVKKVLANWWTYHLVAGPLGYPQ